MKKLLNALLTVMMAVSFVGCSSSEESSSTAATETSDSSASSSLKIGAIILGDENEGYSYAHIAGIKKACEDLGISESDVIWK